MSLGHTVISLYVQNLLTVLFKSLCSQEPCLKLICLSFPGHVTGIFKFWGIYFVKWLLFYKDYPQVMWWNLQGTNI